MSRTWKPWSAIAAWTLLFAFGGTDAAHASDQRIAEPESGSVYEAVRSSLKLLRDDDDDTWIERWCHPSRCTEDALPSLRRHALGRSMKAAHTCLHGDDDAIVVTQTRGDPESDDTVTVFVRCAEGRMPVPSTLEKVDDDWRISSFSW